MRPSIPAPQANKQAQAARLRDVCLELVRSHGVLREMSGYALTEVVFAPFTIWVVPWRQLSSLDVWYDGVGRVLTLRLEESAVTILRFQRGPWEDELLALPSEVTSRRALLHRFIRRRRHWPPVSVDPDSLNLVP